MPELGILLTVLATLALGIRASWVWTLRGRYDASAWRATAGTLSVSLVLLNSLWFICLFCKREIGGSGTHYVTTRLVSWYFLASILVTIGACLVKGEGRREALLAGT